MYLVPSFKRKGKVPKGSKLKHVSLRRPIEIKWSFLMEVVRAISRIKRFPPRDFKVLKKVLPRDLLILKFLLPTGGEGHLKLQQGCPLTPTLLTLFLKFLEYEVRQEGFTTSVCHHRLSLLIYTDDEKLPSVKNIVSKFKERSGLHLTMAST